MHTSDLCMETDERVGISTSQSPAQSFGQVLSTALPSLRRRAYLLLGNTADAEDAVQDALLAAYSHLDQFKGNSQLSTWITAIVHNCARMQLRSRRRQLHVSLEDRVGRPEELTVSERLADHRPSPEDECCNSELRARLRRFHRRLSPGQRKAFELRDVEGLSIRETARILGVPSGTVKAQSARARKKLQDLMRQALKPRCPN